MSVLNNNNSNSDFVGTDARNRLKQQKQLKDARKAATQRKETQPRLSMVKEEPDIPPERGDSYFEDTNNPDGSLHRMCAAVSNSFMSSGSEEENDDIGENDVILPSSEAENEEGTGLLDRTLSNDTKQQNLNVGRLVGIQLKPSSSSSIPKQQPQQVVTSASSISSSFSLKKHPLEWKVGSSINIHNVHLLSLTKLSELHYQISNNYSTLRELVLDGISTLQCITMDEAEIIFYEGLSVNTSIKKLSMRYSEVNDEFAALFALALTDNTTLHQLTLEGNDMTTTSAKNFYSVLKKNNDTLRTLNLSNNPMIDDDVELALDQFMEQRAFKRTMVNKAEKARRAARGLPPDTTLDDDEDDETDGHVTVVCSQSVIDGAMEEEGDGTGDDEYLTQLKDMANDTDAYPGESFRDYMQRMDEIKRNNAHSPVYQQSLMDESDREREAFANFVASGGDKGSPNVDGNGSTGSSITTRSTHKRQAGDEGAEITTTNDEEAGRPTIQTSNRKSYKSLTQSSLSLGSEGDSEAFALGPGSMRMSGIQEPHGQLGTSPHPYHNTQSSTGSGSELDISGNDYMDAKASEQEMRARLASSGGAVGAYHIDEAAPSRQFASGPGGGGRRGRVRRTESQRRARLAQLEGGGGGGGATTAAAPSARNLAAVAGGGIDVEDLMDADVEDPYNYDQTEHKKSRFAVIGLGGEDQQSDRMICAMLALLFFALLIMIILLTAL